MKNIILTITIGLIFYNCKAQNPVFFMEDANVTKSKAPNNSYYKDANNTLNTFKGTWLYSNGNTSLKIILVKKEMYHYQAGTRSYYEDLLVGGYQYIKDGVEKINTLSDANNPSMGRKASIMGNNIFNNCKLLPINDCADGEKNLSLSIKDIPANGHFGSLRLFKRIINGKETLKANIIMDYLGDANGRAPDPTLPWKMENIVLIKQ